MHTSNTASNSKSSIPRIILTTGEPAGIGPDLIVDISRKSFEAQLTFLADPELLIQRAALLSQSLEMVEYDAKHPLVQHQSGEIIFQPVKTATQVIPGLLDVNNVDYVLNSITSATLACLRGDFDALITLPVNKAIINDSGHSFSGHTEFIGDLCGIDLPVMMLMNETLRVALVTTHLPLSLVSKTITQNRIKNTLQIINADLQTKLGLTKPRMLICGLNPHAGEAGHLGTEETDIIIPVLDKLKSDGLDLTGPVPADTAFTPGSLDGIDIVVAMYHDQGLPILKSQGFGNTVNVTLGLPIIRTSVDHGTALELAGTGKASSSSLQAAIETAINMVRQTSLSS